MRKQLTHDPAKRLEDLDHRVYRLKISIADVDPPIWRRLEVFAGIEMQSLASAIDIVFGWSGEHTGEFDIKGQRLGDGTHWVVDDPRRPADLRRRTLELLSNTPAKGQSAQGSPGSVLTLEGRSSGRIDGSGIRGWR